MVSLQTPSNSEGLWACYEHVTRHEVSYLICCDSLLQSATDFITECDSYIIAKYDRILFQHVSGFYYEIELFYCKMRQLCYKMRRLLQIATVHMIKAVDLIKKKNKVQNAWEAIPDELDFVEDVKNFFCYFYCFYWLHILPVFPSMFFFNNLKCKIWVIVHHALNVRYCSLTLLHFLYDFKNAISLALVKAQYEQILTKLSLVYKFPKIFSRSQNIKYAYVLFINNWSSFE